MARTGHQLTEADREQWLQRNTFECPVYRARLTPQACAANRQRPLKSDCAVDDFGASGGKQPLLRKPGCGDDCATWLAQRDKNLGKEGPRHIAACAYCGRANMSSPARGLCGSCNALAVRGELVKGDNGKWRTAEPDTTLADLATEHAANAQDMPGQARPVVVGGDKVPPIAVTYVQQLMGADTAEQLLTAEDLERLRAAEGEGEAVPKSPAAKPPADSPASSLPQPSGPALATAGPGGIPDDFEPYQGMPHGSRYPGPMVALRPSGDIELTSEAVRMFNLLDVPRVRFFWSARRGQIGILPTRDSGPGTFKMQNAKGDRRRTSSAFLRTNGITARGVFPVTLGPGGMLVATIDTQAAQGGEEAA